MQIPAWAYSYIVKLAITFALRQLAKWRDQIDFFKVKADFAARVRLLVPGDWFDDEASALTDALLDKISAVLQSTGVLEQILDLVVKGDFTAALGKLKDLLLGHMLPDLDISGLSADEKDEHLCSAVRAAPQSGQAKEAAQGLVDRSPN